MASRDKKEAVKIAGFSDRDGGLVIVFVIDAGTPVRIDDMSLKTSRRLFDHVQLASLFVENRPFLPYVCTVLPLSQAEIDAAMAELRVRFADGRTETFAVPIDGPAAMVAPPTRFSEDALRQSLGHFRAMGLSLARALAFGHAMTAGIAQTHTAIPADREGGATPVADRYRKALLRNLSTIPARCASRPFDRVIRLHRGRVVDVMDTRMPSPPGMRGLVVSISHDCYVHSVGGTQILVSDEQRRFNAMGYRYVHISPHHPLPSIDPEGHGAELVELVVDGVHAGTTDYADVAWAIGASFARRALDRHFVVHCALGHQIDGLIALQRAAEPSRNWYWVHDFSSLCSNHTLLRNNVSFCGAPEPGSAACGVCVHGQDRRRHLSVVERLFAAVDFHVVAPSHGALELWRRGARLPTLSTSVVEHCRLVERGVRAAVGDGSTLGMPGNPVHVAFVGAPTLHKGWRVFEELVAALPLSFSYRFHHFAAPEVFRHLAGVTEVAVAVGPANRDAMIGALAAHGIDLVLVPSILPETFSFVTHEALAAGADVVALDVGGNVAATVSRLGRGRVFATEGDLLAFFTGFAAVDHVRDRLQTGIPAGTLDHCGTTAALVEPAEATA